MARTVPRTVVAILVVFAGLLLVAGGAFASLPVCTADGASCGGGAPLSVVASYVLVGCGVAGAGLAFNRRY